MPETELPKKVRQLEIGSDTYDIALPSDAPTETVVKTVGITGSDLSTTDQYLHAPTTNVASYAHTHSLTGNIDIGLAAVSEGDTKIVIVPDGETWWNSTTGELKLKTQTISAAFVTTGNNKAMASGNTAPSNSNITDTNAQIAVTGVSVDTTDTSSVSTIVTAASFTPGTATTTTVYKQDLPASETNNN